MRVHFGKIPTAVAVVHLICGNDIGPLLAVQMKCLSMLPLDFWATKVGGGSPAASVDAEFGT